MGAAYILVPVSVQMEGHTLKKVPGGHRLSGMWVRALGALPSPPRGSLDMPITEDDRIKMTLHLCAQYSGDEK